MNTFTLRLSATELDVARTVTSGQMFRWKRLEDDSWFGQDGNAWYRILQDSHGLMVQTNRMESEVTRLFRLDDNLVAFVERLKESAPELLPMLSSHQGLRLMNPLGTVETFFSFLCTANNNLHRIVPMCNQLASFGTQCGFAYREELWAFPGTERIARLSSDDLLPKGFGYRARTIPKAAQAVAVRGGDAYIESLKSASYPELFAEIVSLPGYGPKLADCVALFAYGRTEAVPLDTHLWRALTDLYFPEWRSKSLTELRYRQAGDLLREKFGEMAGWVQQLLFVNGMVGWRERKRS